MLKPTHKGVHSNGLEIALFSFLRSQFGQELSILSVGPSHKLGDKCDRLHICSRKTHIDRKIKNKKCIHQTFIRIYFVLRLKFLNLTIKDKAEKTKLKIIII